MKRQTLKQRRSLAAKKGWLTRKEAQRCKVIEDARGALKVDEDINALSNGPPNIKRDTDWGTTTAGMGSQLLSEAYAHEVHGLEPDPSTKPTLWQRLKAWWGT